MKFSNQSTGLRVIKFKDIIEDDEPTYAKIKNLEIHNAKISVEVLSRLLPDAPEHARGFIGVTFRIDENDSEFEGMYLRPTNSKCDIQLRRNRSTQYFSYPNFKFYHSRESNPGEYESYADIDLNQWIEMTIVIQDQEASLYLNKHKEPVLVVKDLKYGPNKKGSIGLWVDVGTEGYFKNLTVEKKD
ncbi:hypothetical protein A1D21_03050 [Aerococcus loyolae]|nr:hypothetical protein A1D21_03050 [Aerococcus loyolae]